MFILYLCAIDKCIACPAGNRVLNALSLMIFFVHLVPVCYRQVLRCSAGYRVLNRLRLMVLFVHTIPVCYTTRNESIVFRNIMFNTIDCMHWTAVCNFLFFFLTSFSLVLKFLSTKNVFKSFSFKCFYRMTYFSSCCFYLWPFLIFPFIFNSASFSSLYQVVLIP